MASRTNLSKQEELDVPNVNVPPDTQPIPFTRSLLYPPDPSNNDNSTFESGSLDQAPKDSGDRETSDETAGPSESYRSTNPYATVRRNQRPTHISFSSTPPTVRFSRQGLPVSPTERLPWSTLRHYSGTFINTPTTQTFADGFFPPPSEYEYPQTAFSFDDGRSLFSVIMDDGTKQRRRISLTSELSPTLPRNATSENTPLLQHDHEFDSDEDEGPGLKHQHRQHFEDLDVERPQNSCLFRPVKLSTNTKRIIKCALAYFLASLFTYIPQLNEWVGLHESQNSHLLASIAIFFNPAKTIGGMFQAVSYALLAWLYGVLICLGSMTSAVWFNDQDMYTIGHIVTLIVWCGGSMFIIAFVKAALNNPTVQSACSLSTIIIFVVVCKEGSVRSGEFNMEKIIQVTTIFLVGISISFLVSILIWPESASQKLKNDVGKTLGSFRLLLKLLTKTFLIDDINYTDASVQSAIQSHHGTFTSLQNSLEQAKLEIENHRQLPLYREVVKSLQRLAQHLGGLRSSCGLQWERMRARDEDDDSPRRPSGNLTEEEEFGDLGVLLEFIHHVGPHMKSLAFTCKQTMAHLQNVFVASSAEINEDIPSFLRLQQNLEAALTLFETSQTRAVTRLYKQKSINGHFDGRPNEEVFLIYFFVFNLQEFTRELERLVILVGGIHRIRNEMEERRKNWWKVWLWCNFREDKTTESIQGVGASSKHNSKVEFPEHTHNLFNTLQTPNPTTKWQAFAIILWKWLNLFRRYDVKFAFKAAVSAVLLAALAFIDSTRDTFLKYRMEWVCISMIVVMVPTVGGTNIVGLYRIIGTFIGVWIAVVVYNLFPDNAPVLAIIGFLVALPCFYILFHTKYTRMGTFALLGFNLVALFRFNLRNADKTISDIHNIAIYRSVGVSSGVLLGVLVTRYWWPYEARTELRKGLSRLLINMSWLYKKLIEVYSVHKPTSTPGIVTPGSPPTVVTLTQSTHHHLSTSMKEFLQLELFLQVSILKLRDLLQQAPHEPRLKGPFPVKKYSNILASCQNILDKMLSMRIAVTKEQFYEAIRRDFIIPISRERRELAGNMLLYFYVLAAALQLKTPLPPYLPPADQARRRMIRKIRDLPVVKQRLVEGDDGHYIVYYAYALVMEDIIRELENLGGIMQELFGTMGGSDFDDFFTEEETTNTPSTQEQTPQNELIT